MSKKFSTREIFPLYWKIHRKTDNLIRIVNSVQIYNHLQTSNRVTSFMISSIWIHDCAIKMQLQMWKRTDIRRGHVRSYSGCFIKSRSRLSAQSVCILICGLTLFSWKKVLYFCTHFFVFREWHHKFWLARCCKLHCWLHFFLFMNSLWKICDNPVSYREHILVN